MTLTCSVLTPWVGMASISSYRTALSLAMFSPGPEILPGRKLNLVIFWFDSLRASGIYVHPTDPQ